MKSGLIKYYRSVKVTVIEEEVKPGWTKIDNDGEELIVPAYELRDEPRIMRPSLEEQGVCGL